MLSTPAKLLAASCLKTLDHLLPTKQLEGLTQLSLAAAPRLHGTWPDTTPHHLRHVHSRAHWTACTGGRGFAAAAAGDAQTWQNDLGQAMQLIAQGSQDAGRELLQKGISTAVQQLGTSNHPMVAVMSNQASVIYMIGSMYEDAEAAARESLTIIKNFCVPTSVEVAACQLRLAAILVARQQVAEAKRLLATVTTSLSGSEQHQDAFGEALFYTGMCQLLGAHSYEAVKRLDDLLVEGLRKFGEKIDLQRPLVDVALREHALLRSRAEERGEWGVVEALLQQALLLVKQVGVAVQLRGLLALQLGVVQFKHRGKEELARETFAAALEALGDTVDDSMDIVQQGLRRYEVLSDLLKRYGAGALNQG